MDKKKHKKKIDPGTHKLSERDTDKSFLPWSTIKLKYSKLNRKTHKIPIFSLGGNPYY